jgi:hypothetical protein
MNQALYAHMNNKRKMKKEKNNKIKYTLLLTSCRSEHPTLQKRKKTYGLFLIASEQASQ